MAFRMRSKNYGFETSEGGAEIHTRGSEALGEGLARFQSNVVCQKAGLVFCEWGKYSRIARGGVISVRKEEDNSHL